MITAVGLNARMTTASVLADISGYKVSDYYSDSGQPITMTLIEEALSRNWAIDIEEGEEYGEQDEHVVKMALASILEAWMELRFHSLYR